MNTKPKRLMNGLGDQPAGRRSRRAALKMMASLSGGLLLAACSTPTSPAPTRLLAATATRLPTLAPATATLAATAAAASTAPPAPTVAAEPPAATPTTGAPALATGITGAANAFLAALDDGQRSKATYAFVDAERERWHWTTPRNFPRHGLPLREMSQAQRDLALNLLRASISPAGFQKALDIMSLQNDLGNDPELYYVTVFGAPPRSPLAPAGSERGSAAGTSGGAEPWGWRFEGHHLSRNFTLVGNLLAVTPFFLGAWPTVSAAGLKAMEREEWAARELITSLEGAGRQAALFQERTLTRHLTQNQPYVSPLDPVGVLAGDLAGDQQALLLEIVQTYLGTLPVDLATVHFERLSAAGLENVRFGWAGPLEPRRPHYYRLQGPSFLLEFDNSRNGGGHIHSVWRDFAEDFGQHLV